MALSFGAIHPPRAYVSTVRCQQSLPATMRLLARSSCVRSLIHASLGSAPSAALACATRLSTVLQVAGIATLGPAPSVWHAGSHKISSSNPALVRYLRQRARIIVNPLLGRG